MRMMERVDRIPVDRIPVDSNSTSQSPGTLPVASIPQVENIPQVECTFNLVITPAIGTTATTTNME